MADYLLSSDTLAEDDVVNAQGESLGNIKDLMIDPVGGQVEYAVLSFGGVMGIGDKLFAVPFEHLHVDRANKCLVLNVDKDRLKDAPGFEKDQWPDFADPAFRSTVTDFYGAGARP